MIRTENQETLHIVLKAFSDAAYENYGGHAFEAGYLQSLCISMLESLPKKQQKIVIDAVVQAAVKQEKEVLAKRRDMA